MKAKNQPQYTSDAEAKEKLIIFVYEYLIHSNAKQAADKFIQTIGYQPNIEVKEGPGFLLEWWCVFWDLYCAAPERRNLQPESSSDARAFHDLIRSAPSIPQTSPPQQPPPHVLSGPPRHHGPPQHPHPRGPPIPRMQAGPPPPLHQHDGPHVPPGYMPSGSPRYVQHQGPQPPQPHMNHPAAPPPPPMNYGPGPDQMGVSPNMNRMTPVGGPPHQQAVGPPGSAGPSMVGMGQSNSQMMGPAGQNPPQMPMQSAGPPPRTGSRGGWQGNFSSSSPADQQCFMPPAASDGSQGGQEFGGMMMSDNNGMIDIKPTPNANANNGGSNNGANTNSRPASNQAQPQQDEYVIGSSYGQQATDTDAGSEIRMLKESLENDTDGGDQSGFSLDYDSQSKWQ